MVSERIDASGSARNSLAGLLLADRYRLTSLIANGGMAQVWEAHDRVLGRDVAVKLLHNHLAADAVFVERFRNEAVAAGRLAHPSIVSIFDVCSDDEREAIVMELVRGQSLRQYLDDVGQMDPQLAVPWMIQVADALTAAHDQGVVHRDIKPANILIVDKHRVKVTDFGIAKASSAADLTEVGMMMGTAKYLAPEQVAGEAVDGRADVYALGILLYEAICGVVPFQGDNDTATAVMRLQRDPVLPRHYRPDISAGLEAVMLRALERHPDDRYRSATAFKDALRTADTSLHSPGLDPSGSANGPVVGPGGHVNPQAALTTAEPDSLPIIDLVQAERREAGYDEAAWQDWSHSGESRTGVANIGDGHDHDSYSTDGAAQSGRYDGYTASEDHQSPDYESDYGQAPAPHEAYNQPDAHPTTEALPSTDDGGHPLPRRGPTPPSLRSVSLWFLALLAIVALGVAGALFGRTSLGATVADDIRDTFGFGSSSEEPDADEPIPVDNESTARNGVAIANVTSFDPPPGDGEEIDARLTQAVDGIETTSWRTERYSNNPEFGNLKSGVGIVLELEEPAELSSITLNSQTPGWRAQIYLSDARHDTLADWGPPAGAVERVEGSAEVDLGDRSASHVLVFVIKLADEPADDGRYFAEINEIAIQKS